MSDRVSGCLGDWAHNLLIKRSKTFQFCRIKIRFNRSSLPELNNSKYDRHNVTVGRKRKRTSKKKEYIACRVRIVVTYSPTPLLNDYFPITQDVLKCYTDLQFNPISEVNFLILTASKGLVKRSAIMLSLGQYFTSSFFSLYNSRTK